MQTVKICENLTTGASSAFSIDSDAPIVRPSSILVKGTFDGASVYLQKLDPSGSYVNTGSADVWTENEEKIIENVDDGTFKINIVGAGGLTSITAWAYRAKLV